MAKRPARFHPRGPVNPVERQREADQRRGSARSRGYTAEWDKASAAFLDENPFCEYCAKGVFGPVDTVSADLTDHLYPHRGDQELFWRAIWWVGSCTTCHSGPKQRLEGQGLPFINALAKRLGRPIRS
ncbi:hypothetical protein [Phenylobacterium sp.]|uniref:hypothetical protein n=1 Tax=Phenylobacterium sp. TaxID=1871053 RepID=UPI00273404D9|nr:hypothetical protein [Phenylobacterium sp.]MDP3853631.1 hypothetical protein [Phenylobacterium sp.]